MNNKGFAITTILYGTMILFCLLLISLLGILSTMRSNLHLLIDTDNGARNIVTIKKQNVSSYNDVEDKGLYCINETDCKYISKTNNVFKNNDAVTTIIYTGNYQEFTVKNSGYYKIELWGAQGGSGSFASGGKGGYSSGYIYLNENETLYFYVGNQPKALSQGGYNGGGAGGNNSSYPSYGGGGATDVRLVKGAWDDAASLNSRIMVAGGGGGSYNYSSSFKANGSAGGGLIAQNGIATKNSVATGGTQTAGGIGNNNNTTYSALFGKGGGVTGSLRTGGGGGYYGGGGTYNIGTSAESGAGGSSFISGYAGVNAITSENDRTHTNDTLHYSGKYFVRGTMNSGVNGGNGKAIITYIGNKMEKTNNRLNDVRYIKDCINGSDANANNHWVEIQAIYNGRNIAKGITPTGITNSESKPITNITDGIITSSKYAEGGNKSLTCVTIDLGKKYDLDEIAVWHYFADGRKYNSNTTSVSSNNDIWTAIISNNNVETSNGKRFNAW